MTTSENTVNHSLTPIPRKRRRRIVENSEYAAFAKRVVRAYSRRVGDQADIEALTELAELRGVVNDAITNAVASLRNANPPYSWTDIGRVLGVSKQAAQQRWGGTP